MHAVIETAAFLADAKQAGMEAWEREAFVMFIAAHPAAGDIIPGTGGARKCRFRRPGTGKSGGYRVITFFGGEDVPVFLLSVFAKGDRVNLSQAERNVLRIELARLAEDYREGVGRRVESGRSHS
jgi:hypothetical protein